jgi:hypothetical protein
MARCNFHDCSERRRPARQLLNGWEGEGWGVSIDFSRLASVFRLSARVCEPFGGHSCRDCALRTYAQRERKAVSGSGTSLVDLSRAEGTPGAVCDAVIVFANRSGRPLGPREAHSGSAPAPAGLAPPARMTQEGRKAGSTTVATEGSQIRPQSLNAPVVDSVTAERSNWRRSGQVTLHAYS